LTNYYDILGIQSGATVSEIKAAFRALAKIYHPDKNPGGQEDFKKILRAYETLSNPARKSSYDLKLKYHKDSAHSYQGSKTKNWTFEEKELKRRQYYNDHIKKYEKVKKARAEHAQLKTNYNEYKYILYATPVAVALFLLVIHFATPSHKTKIEPIVKQGHADLKTGDAPYADYFGSAWYIPSSNKTLTLKNNTGEDVIAILFSGNTFVRSCAIKDGFFAEIPQLPQKPLEIRYESGKKWNPSASIPNVSLTGAFSANLAFYRSVEPAQLGAVNEITLIPGTNEGFVKIMPVEFFKKENI
jgi:curved DNA-binding protein CbpA